MTRLVNPEGRRIIAGFLAITAFGLTAEPLLKILAVAPETPIIQEAPPEFIIQFVVATDTPTPTATITRTPTALTTMTASPIPSESPTHTLVPTRKPTTAPTLEKPKALPTKTPSNEIRELTSETKAQINLQPGERIALKYLVYSGDTRLIFSGTGLATDQMEVRSPERLKDRASGGNQKPIGLGNVCPKALLNEFGPGCIVNQSGHWSAEPSQNIWQVEIRADKEPVQGELKLDNSNTGQGGAGCFSYWEYIGPNHVFWTRCPGSSG